MGISKDTFKQLLEAQAPNGRPGPSTVLSKRDKAQLVSFAKFVANSDKYYCSASEVRHPSEVRHLHFMTILENFYCPVMEYIYTLPLKEAIPFI